MKLLPSRATRDLVLTATVLWMVLGSAGCAGPSGSIVDEERLEEEGGVTEEERLAEGERLAEARRAHRARRAAEEESAATRRRIGRGEYAGHGARVALTGGWTLAPALANGGRPAPKIFRPSSAPWTFADVLGTFFEDVAWYRLTLGLDAAWTGARARLEFGGVPTEATVFINGAVVAHQLGNWTPFTADLTQHLRMDGTDLVEVRLSTKLGHNSRWRLRLSEFRRHVREAGERGARPLLYAEASSGEIRLDRDIERPPGPDATPEGWRAHQARAEAGHFEAWATERFGPECVAAFLPDLLTYAHANRKYQIERMALDLPQAGFVSSVGRDIPQAATVFVDHARPAERNAADFDWLGDTMVLLDDDEDRRAFRAGEATRLRVRHFGRGRLSGDLVVSLDGTPLATVAEIELEQGESSRSFTIVLPREALEAPRVALLEARLNGTHPAVNRWNLWMLPRPPRHTGTARKVTVLDQDTLAFVEAGGAALVAVGPDGGGFPMHHPWFDAGGPFVPPHPIHERVPAQMLKDLLAFDLESVPVLRLEALRDQIDPIVARWDTHDAEHINEYVHAFTARVGAGRVLVTSLNLESDAGRWLEAAFLEHLEHGPAPLHELTWRPE